MNAAAPKIETPRKVLPEPKFLITTLKNLITNKDYVDKKKGLHSEIEFLEFSENGIVLGMPATFCGVGNHIQITMDIRTGLENFEFICTTKVIVVEAGPDRQARVELKLFQFNKSQWKAIKDSLERRQELVMAMINSMKG